MTVPIQTPQIGVTGVIQTPGVGEIINHALLQWQDLAQKRQELKRKQEEFELHKKIMGTQLEGTELDNEKKKRAFKAEDADLAARREALTHFMGSLPHLDDPKAIGEEIAKISDPAVAAHYYELVKESHEVRAKAATVQKDELANQRTVQVNTQDQQTHDILQRYDLNTELGQRRAITEVLKTAGPEAADRVAKAVNVGSGRYGHLVGPDGFLYITDSKMGTARRDTAVGQKTAPNAEAIQRGAQTIVDLLDEQSRVIKDAGLEGSKNPTAAQVAQTSRILGLSTEAVANTFRTDPQQITQMLRTRFAHNYVGLLPHSRSSQALLNNLTESYWAPAGSNEEILRRAQRDRKQLRKIMADIAAGKSSDLSRIPGFAEAASAAAAESQVPQAAGMGATAAPNPDDWAGGIPPQ